MADGTVASPPEGWTPGPFQAGGFDPLPDRKIDLVYADGTTYKYMISGHVNWSQDLGARSVVGWRYSPEPCCGSPVVCDRVCVHRDAYVKQHRGDNVYRPLTAQDAKVYDAIAANYATDPQPAPQSTAAPAAWSLVMRDMAERDIFGATKYGVRLQPGNGRDALKDAYQEALDLAVYLRTAIYERDGA